MPSDPGTFSYSALRDRPQEFIVGCQPFIRACIGYYIRKGMVRLADEEDFAQSVTAELIERLPVITARFREQSNFQPYMGAVIHNIILKLRRGQRDMTEVPLLHEAEADRSADPSVPLLLESEVEQFHVIMVLLYRERHRFLLCAKVYLDLEIFASDIRRALPNISAAAAASILAFNEPATRPKRLDERFAVVADALQRFGSHIIEGDSLRRWTQRNMEHVLSLLNGDPPLSAHDHDTLAALIERYTRSEHYPQ
ncbi:MAG: sigma-70 family RNA polymerase sigma factor [Bacteroidetes bacterium]|nr:MAG: sigma-70 family RNA polymerase sigma factor [Bacteroidota bacterium]